MITTQELADLLIEGADVKIVDASMPPATEENFKTVAIAGARYLRLRELKTPHEFLLNTWPSVEQVIKRASEIGVTTKDRIVFYDQPGHFVGATRAWFIFKAHGFKNVQVLDGGSGKWYAEGHKVAPG